MRSLAMLLAETQMVQTVLVLFAGLLLTGITVLVMKAIERSRRAATEKEFAAARAAAEAEAQKIIAQAEALSKTELIERRRQFDSETEETRKQLREEERRITKREDLADKKLDALSAGEKQLSVNEQALNERERSLADKDRQLGKLLDEQNAELLRIAELSMDDARQTILARVEKEMDKVTAQLVDRRLQEAQENCEAQSREILVGAIQRYAADHTCDRTVSTVVIPSDDMKGRVIGREGRNIRSFEKATGVDVIVDDTPGVVVVSAFDPVRREVARRALERLIQDGRIHPTRIEEVVSVTEQEVAKQVQQYGKDAAVEANVRGLHNKLVGLLGRLHFRTSYGQNMLKHSMEVAFLSQMIAEEIGLNGTLARRCGLLHDIGKAVDHEVEGGHPQIGADLCKRYGEKPEVINAAGAHHGDIEATSLYTAIVGAADAVSASRPGARRESLERYIKRLQQLEGIATSFEGVSQAYAIQAGREVRVMVDATNVDDRLSAKMAHDIAKRVEDEMEYPGEVKVTLVREVRCIEYAR